MIYCIDTSVLDTTRKIHKNYIREPSGLFSIVSQVSLSMTQVITDMIYL